MQDSGTGLSRRLLSIPVQSKAIVVDAFIIEEPLSTETMSQSISPKSYSELQDSEVQNLTPLNPKQRNQVIETLESWCNVNEEEAQEQQATAQQLFKALDEERTRIGARKLFE